MEDKSFLNYFIIQYSEVFITHVVPKLSFPDYFFLARVSKSMRHTINPLYEKSKRFIIDPFGSKVVDSVSRLKWCISNGLNITMDYFEYAIEEGHEEIVDFLRNNEDYPELQHDFLEYMELCARVGFYKLMKQEFALNVDIVNTLIMPKSSTDTKRTIYYSQQYQSQFKILYQAASQGHVIILHWLCPLFFEENKTHSDICMITELCHEACHNWHDECATYLLSLGAEKDVYTCYIAARDRNLYLVKFLIQNDFPIDQELIDQIYENFKEEDPAYCLWIKEKYLNQCSS
jgi:hypothetical protein